MVRDVVQVHTFPFTESYVSKLDLLLNTTVSYTREVPFPSAQLVVGGSESYWLSVTLGRNTKTLPYNRPSREMDRQQMDVETGSCVMGKGECAEGGTLALPEEKPGALGESVLQSAESVARQSPGWSCLAKQHFVPL